MRIFAIQTDIDVLKRRFLVEDEEELLTLSGHGLVFVFPAIIVVILTVILHVVGFLAMENEALSFFAVSMTLLTWYALSMLVVLHAFIRWKFNFVVITTEKVVCITQKSFFYQDINPVNVDNIASTRTKSQFLGFFRIGKLHINLKERTLGSSREIILKYIPQPIEVAGVIEKAIVLSKQRRQKGEGIEEQQTRIHEVKKQSDHKSD